MNNRLREALYHTAASSCCSIEMAHGIVMGVVAALMFKGYTFEGAMSVVSVNLPAGFRMSCIPACWREYILAD